MRFARLVASKEVELFLGLALAILGQTAGVGAVLLVHGGGGGGQLTQPRAQL